MLECRTVRHTVSPVPEWTEQTMLGQVRYRTKLTQSGIFLVRYLTKILDARMPMPALVFSMPMPSYAYQLDLLVGYYTPWSRSLAMSILFYSKVDNVVNLHIFESIRNSSFIFSWQYLLLGRYFIYIFFKSRLLCENLPHKEHQSVKYFGECVTATYGILVSRDTCKSTRCYTEKYRRYLKINISLKNYPKPSVVM